MRNLLPQLLLCLALSACAAGCASPFSGGKSSLTDFERAHIFSPKPYPEGNWSPTGFEFEDAWFTAPDGTRLNGWYCRHEHPVAVALFAHGNAGNLSYQADTLRNLRDRHHLSVMIFDYRGYGKSEGEPDEAGILQDARAARRWLAHRENIDERDIVLIGESLGGGVMVDLAAGEGARGLVLAGTFTSLPDVAAHHFPLSPARLAMQSRLDSVGKIARFHGSLLQVHGDRDRTIPFELGKRLFDAANEPKRLVVSRGADHNDPFPDEFHGALDEFLAALPPVQSPAQSDAGKWRAAGSSAAQRN